MESAIVGAGIGGLTLAIALEGMGFQPRVYEAAAEFKSLGAGIVIAANAWLALRRLGGELEARLVAHGHRIDSMRMTDARLQTLQETDITKTATLLGAASYSFHRAELHAALLAHRQHLNVQLGRTLTHCAETNGRVLAAFADGSSTEADLLIGADGLRSRVRGVLFPHARLRYAGQTSWRGVTGAVPEIAEHTCLEAFGRGRRFGAVRLSQNRLYWFAVVNAPEGGTTKDKTSLQAEFCDFHPVVHDLIDATPEAAILRTDLNDLAPLNDWYQGRIMLLGDAAHATTPNLGQGGNQAIEDAVCLALQLAKNPRRVDEAFAAHVGLRREKADRVVAQSRRMGKIAQLENPLLIALRNALLQRVPPQLVERQLRWLLRINF